MHQTDESTYSIFIGVASYWCLGEVGGDERGQYGGWCRVEERHVGRERN